MKELSNENIKKIEGGGLSFWGALGIVTGVIFAIGVVDGYKPQCLHKRV